MQHVQDSLSSAQNRCSGQCYALPGMAALRALRPGFLPPPTHRHCRPTPMTTHSRCWHQGTALRRCWLRRLPAQAHPPSWYAPRQRAAAVAVAAPAAGGSWGGAPSQRCCRCCRPGCWLPRWRRLRQPACRPPHRTVPAQTCPGRPETGGWPSRTAVRQAWFERQARAQAGDAWAGGGSELLARAAAVVSGPKEVSISGLGPRKRRGPRGLRKSDGRRALKGAGNGGLAQH